MAVLLDAGQPCSLVYEVSVDSSWITRSATVIGFRGNKAVGLRIRRSVDGHWRVGAITQPAVAGCIDVDLGFTPATNMLAVRRIGLAIGEQADAPAAWLALPSTKLRVLPQTYLRTAALEYDYDAPSVGYKGRLHVSSLGAVVTYSGLFEAVHSPGNAQ